MLLHLRTKIQVLRNEIANKAKKSVIYVTVGFVTCRKRHDGEMCNCGRGRERGCKMASGRNMDSKFWDSHITGKHPSPEDGAMKALMSPHCTGEERRVSQCSGHVYRLDLLLWQQRNAFNRDHYRIIVSLS